MVKKVDRKATPAPKPTTLAEGLAKVLAESGQPVSPETAAILEADLENPVKTFVTTDGEEVPHLEIPSFTAEPLAQADVSEKPINDQVVVEQEPVVVEPIITEQEAVIMENTTTEHVVDTQAAVAAAQPQGVFARSWNWAKQNKGKLALGTAAVVGVGVGIYYLARTGNAAKAVETATAVVTEAAASVTETAAV